MAKSTETVPPPVEAVDPPTPASRLHIATYASDKRNPGGYLIRIEGPTASRFEGREVPVTRKDHTESREKLEKCIWAGLDNETGNPVALYRFEQKPREQETNENVTF